MPSLHIQNVTGVGILSKCIQGGDFSNNEYFLESSLWYLKSGFKWHKKCSNTNENSFNNVKRRYRRLNMHDEAWTALDWCYCRITKLFQWCKFRATGTFTPCMAPFLQSLSWKKKILYQFFLIFSSQVKAADFEIKCGKIWGLQ